MYIYIHIVGLDKELRLRKKCRYPRWVARSQLLCCWQHEATWNSTQHVIFAYELLSALRLKEKFSKVCC